MFERELALFRFMHDYLQRLTEDLLPEDLLHVLPGATNPPAYVLGHLAVCNDMTLRILQQPMLCPEGWVRSFGPGSNPEKMTIGYPSREELLGVLHRQFEAIVAALPGADAAGLDRPHSAGVLRGTAIETVGDLLAHLLTTHFALHVGQLSLMRRQRGRSPLF